MKQSYTTYQKYNENGEKAAEFTFYESDTLLEGIEISTPLNFAFSGSEVILAMDKTMEWNTACGKIDSGEDWKTAIVRETREELGVIIEEDNLNLIGYILAENFINPNFPSKSLLPVTYSFSKSIDFSWNRKETSDRRMVKVEKASSMLSTRNDNGQLLEIFNYINSIKFKGIDIEFEFIPNEILPGIDTTSAMTFCINENREICIVKDESENFYSLPGGSRELTESIEECAYRELLEESQIEGSDFKVFGTIVVNIKKGNKLISQIQQARFICRAKAINNFIPGKGGFETDQRHFVDISELILKVRQFQNENGEKIINHLRKVI
jgi:ADP-ribose pyrophosphatase YjhB (NUDIX family)